jgi:hypothetical protein
MTAARSAPAQYPRHATKHKARQRRTEHIRDARASAQDRFVDETPQQQVKHAEIASRYRAHARAKADDRHRLSNLTLGEIKKLLWDQHYPSARYHPSLDMGWPQLPDTEASRRVLHVIRSYGTPQGFRCIAADAAPWLSDSDRGAIEPERFSPERIGRVLGLTEAKRTALNIRTIWPCDVPRSQKRTRERKLATERMRRSRAKQKAAKDTGRTERAVAFLQEILQHRPMAVASLMRIAAKRGLEQDGATKPGGPLKRAAKVLGIVTAKTGLSDGWQWGLPGPKMPKIPYFIEGDTEASRIGEKPPVFPKATKSVTHDSILVEIGMRHSGDAARTVPPSTTAVDASPDQQIEAPSLSVCEEASPAPDTVTTSRADSGQTRCINGAHPPHQDSLKESCAAARKKIAPPPEIAAQAGEVANRFADKSSGRPHVSEDEARRLLERIWPRIVRDGIAMANRYYGGKFDPARHLHWDWALQEALNREWSAREAYRQRRKLFERNRKDLKAKAAAFDEGEVAALRCQKAKAAARADRRRHGLDPKLTEADLRRKQNAGMWCADNLPVGHPLRRAYPLGDDPAVLHQWCADVEACRADERAVVELYGGAAP